MMPARPPIPPDILAEFDQAAASAETELDALTAAFGLLAARKGDPEATADMAVYLLSKDADTLVLMLLSVIRRGARPAAPAGPRWSCPECGSAHVDHERDLLFCEGCGHTWPLAPLEGP